MRNVILVTVQAVRCAPSGFSIEAQVRCWPDLLKFACHVAHLGDRFVFLCRFRSDIAMFSVVAFGFAPSRLVLVFCRSRLEPFSVLHSFRNICNV